MLTADEAKEVAEETVLDLIERLVSYHGAEDAGLVLRFVAREVRTSLRTWSDITEMLA